MHDLHVVGGGFQTDLRGGIHCSGTGYVEAEDEGALAGEEGGDHGAFAPAGADAADAEYEADYARKVVEGHGCRIRFGAALKGVLNGSESGQRASTKVPNGASRKTKPGTGKAECKRQ